MRNLPFLRNFISFRHYSLNRLRNNMFWLCSVELAIRRCWKMCFHLDFLDMDVWKRLVIHLADNCQTTQPTHHHSYLTNPHAWGTKHVFSRLNLFFFFKMPSSSKSKHSIPVNRPFEIWKWTSNYKHSRKHFRIVSTCYLGAIVRCNHASLKVVLSLSWMLSLYYYSFKITLDS